MGMKSKNGKSSVSVNAGSALPSNPNSGIKIINGSSIVNKPLNTHHQQPGLKGKVGL